MPKNFGIGDPVEIRKIIINPDNAPDEWFPATVLRCTAEKVSVMYADHRREDVPNLKHRIRAAGRDDA